MIVKVIVSMFTKRCTLLESSVLGVVNDVSTASIKLPPATASPAARSGVASVCKALVAGVI